MPVGEMEFPRKWKMNQWVKLQRMRATWHDSEVGGWGWALGDEWSFWGKDVKVKGNVEAARNVVFRFPNGHAIALRAVRWRSGWISGLSVQRGVGIC